jgi:hypothetical protein
VYVIILKPTKMNELKTKYEAIKSLAKEMMKLGNIAEYFRLINEATAINKLMLSTRLVQVL